MLYRKTEELLKSRQNTVPSLVHGDLWGGNWSMVCTDSGDVQPIVFDPSSSYSDPEFEFGIMRMFGNLVNLLVDFNVLLFRWMDKRI